MIMELCTMLRSGPPSLSHLGEILTGADNYAAFKALAHEYLPENEEQILALPLLQGMEKFNELFGARYFPLEGREDIEDLVNWIPVQLMGLSYDDYHYFADRLSQGHILIASLVTSPNDTSARVPIVEEAARTVGSAIFKKVPEDGWQPEFLRERLDKTEWEGVAAVAEWIWCSTGIEQLDMAWEDGMEPPQWDREMVDYLANQWTECKKRLAQMEAVEKVMEKPGKFNELVDLLLAAPPKKAMKQKTLMETLHV